jgi:hypothetical protein
MFTSFYCVVHVIQRSAAFDILSKGAGKKRIVVDASKGIAHRFRPLVGDVIRPSPPQHPTDSADVEVRAYRWTGDEASTTKFNPVADVTLSLDYPARGDGHGLSFGPDDDLRVLTDALADDHSSAADRSTLQKPPRKKKHGISPVFYSEQVKLSIKKSDG